MYSIVGVGKGVKNLMQCFDQYKEYKTFYLDEEALGNFSSMADYENNFPTTAIRKTLKSITKNSEVLYVLEGGDPISGATLRILEVIKRAKTTVLYVVPDRDILTDQEKYNESLTFRALQDIARCGDLEQVILVDLNRVEVFLGDIPLENYDAILAHNIVNTFAMLNYFDHIDPVKTTKKKLPDAVRISTIGILSPDDEECMFYDLQWIKDKEYCYGVTDEDMKKSSLLREIRSKIKKSNKDTRCYYSIYSIESDQVQKFLRTHTDICQTRNEKIDAPTP